MWVSVLCDASVYANGKLFCSYLFRFRVCLSWGLKRNAKICENAFYNSRNSNICQHFPPGKRTSLFVLNAQRTTYDVKIWHNHEVAARYYSQPDCFACFFFIRLRLPCACSACLLARCSFLSLSHPLPIPISFDLLPTNIRMHFATFAFCEFCFHFVRSQQTTCDYLFEFNSSKWARATTTTRTERDREGEKTLKEFDSFSNFIATPSAYLSLSF